MKNIKNFNNQSRKFITTKEKLLEELHLKSNLPAKPDANKIKEILLQCLEHSYGNLSDCIIVPDRTENLLKQIKQLIIDAGY